MKRQSIFYALSLLISTLFISCNLLRKPTATAIIKQPFDVTIAKKQIEDINRNYMELVAKSDSIGVANLYAKDARLLFAGIPVVVGRNNIQKVFARLINSGVTKLDLETIKRG